MTTNPTVLEFPAIWPGSPVQYDEKKVRLTPEQAAQVFEVTKITRHKDPKAVVRHEDGREGTIPLRQLRVADRPFVAPTAPKFVLGNVVTVEGGIKGFDVNELFVVTSPNDYKDGVNLTVLGGWPDEPNRYVQRIPAMRLTLVEHATF